MNAIPVRCPNCERRLFDLSTDREVRGIIRAKCPRCKTVAILDLSIYNRDESCSALSSASEPSSQTPPVR